MGYKRDILQKLEANIYRKIFPRSGHHAIMLINRRWRKTRISRMLNNYI